jgi:NedA-like, galactose-binding domain
MRVGEWFLRTQEIRAARAQLPGRDALASRAFEQLRLVREIARQVTDPVEPSPVGRRAPLLLSLYRDAVYWALVAGAPGAGRAAPNLAGLWQRAERDRLVHAAGGEQNLDALHGLLVELGPADSLDLKDQDIERVRTFADALYDELAAPRRRAAGIAVQRWLRLAAAAAALIAIVVFIRSVVVGPNLADRTHMRVSSQQPGCAQDPGCTDAMFHTSGEDHPWVEFDLGKTQTIHVINIVNRVDCCQDRAVPLIAEISTDGAHWKQVGRQDKEFKDWKVKFPRTPARFVKLRVEKWTLFHLADVTIR